MDQRKSELAIIIAATVAFGFLSRLLIYKSNTPFILGNKIAVQ